MPKWATSFGAQVIYGLIIGLVLGFIAVDAEPLAATLHGDVGAKAYLEAHDTLGVECGDLATGRDRDRR